LKNITWPLFVLLLATAGCKAHKLAPAKPVSPAVYKTPANFRVVGYLLSGEIANGASASFDLSRVTYLNIFFNGQDAHHKLKHLAHLDSTITAAHQLHVTVLASIGNGTKLSLLTDSGRAGFVDSLMKSLDELHLDGIDVDLEDKSINNNYEAFIGDLSVALRQKGKLLTAAVATWESPLFTDKALSYFDFLNLMTYDDTGPWRLNEPGPHSPYSMAVSDLDFWTNKRGIAKSKLNLGLPFYGYSFGPGAKHEYHYREIVEMLPGAESVDKAVVSPADTVYYNGLITIKQKTAFAIQNAGGVMVWELLEDAPGEKSLLTAIDQVVGVKKSLGVSPSW
jgi:chitinase